MTPTVDIQRKVYDIVIDAYVARLGHIANSHKKDGVYGKKNFK